MSLKTKPSKWLEARRWKKQQVLRENSRKLGQG